MLLLAFPPNAQLVGLVTGKMCWKQCKIDLGKAHVNDCNETVWIWINPFACGLLWAIPSKNNRLCSQHCACILCALCVTSAVRIFICYQHCAYILLLHVNTNFPSVWRNRLIVCRRCSRCQHLRQRVLEQRQRSFVAGLVSAVGVETLVVRALCIQKYAVVFNTVAGCSVQISRLQLPSPELTL